MKLIGFENLLMAFLNLEIVTNVAYFFNIKNF